MAVPVLLLLLLSLLPLLLLRLRIAIRWLDVICVCLRFTALVLLRIAFPLALVG